MGKKRSKPEMTWIESRKRWRKRKVIGGKLRDVYGATQDEVREKIKEMERLTDSGILLDDRTSLCKMAQNWLAVKKPQVRPGTAAMYEGCMSRHVIPYFKHMMLRDIKPLHVQMFMAEKAHLSNSQQTKLLITLSQIMETAVANGLIATNPCRGIKAAGRPAKEKIPLTRAQQDELLHAVKGTRVEVFVMLCLFAGLRREEALGLLWSDIHLDSDAPYLEVRHSVTYDHGNPIHSDQLKSKAARRKIPIPPALEEVLRQTRSNSSSMLVVPAVRTGQALSEKGYERLWELAQKRVTFHVHAHLLRHTYLTNLCASGMDIKKIQYLAGHENVNITLKIYAHVTNNSPSDLYGQITEIFDQGVSDGVKRFRIKKLT